MSRHKNLQRIMFWSEDHKPKDFIGALTKENISRADQNKVLLALQNGKSLARYRGSARCRICEQRLGSSDLGNDVFVWPSGCEHYIISHDVWTPGLDKLLKAIQSGPEPQPKPHPGRRSPHKGRGRKTRRSTS